MALAYCVVMEPVQLVIPGKPRQKQTHRYHYKVNWAEKEIKQWSHFPQRKEAEAVRKWLRENYRGPLLEGSLFVSFTFYMPIPKRYSKKLKTMITEGLLHHCQKPDASNLAKYYEDCMNGIVYKDDCQIIWLSPVKVYDKDPRTEILIQPFDYEMYQRFMKGNWNRDLEVKGE